MSTWQIAFFIGLFGSVHCIGMCGPLAFSIPVNSNTWWRIVADKLLYNAGRIIVYTALGLQIGFIGRQLWLIGLQQGISIVSGVLIIMAGLSRLFKISFFRGGIFTSALNPINRLIGCALKQRWGHLAIGMLNGLLPCGFVYIALIGAINNNSALAAAQYMFWFGLGTFPLMLLATLSSAVIGPAIRRRINTTMPYLMVCLGLWFLLRGLQLNIPYLSPPKPQMGVSICN